jgi:hypothetical protein
MIEEHVSLVMARNEEVVEFKSENYARHVIKETCQSKMLDLISRKKNQPKSIFVVLQKMSLKNSIPKSKIEDKSK